MKITPTPIAAAVALVLSGMTLGAQAQQAVHQIEGGPAIVGIAGRDLAAQRHRAFECRSGPGVVAEVLATAHAEDFFF